MSKASSTTNSTKNSARLIVPLTGRLPLAKLPQPPLTTVLAKLGVAIDDWDIVLVGDGSGSGWLDPCGWASVLIEKLTDCRRTFYGGMNAGSINLAELLPYVHALSWYHARFGEDRLARSHGILRVHILTDSEVTKNVGTRVMLHGTLPKGNRAMWATILEFGRMGYRMTFHWIGRETMALNWLCDALAGNARAAVKDIVLQDLTGKDLNAYDFNPSGKGEPDGA